MSGRSSAAIAATVVLLLAACTSGGSVSSERSASGGSSGSPAASSTSGEATSSASTSSADATSGASSPPAASRSPEASAPPAASVCRETRKAGTVKVSIADFEFKPAAIKARTGQVIGFTNTGFESHNATLDGAGCATGTLQTGGRDGLVFSVAGRYPFHCTVHAWMTGTITIGG